MKQAITALSESPYWKVYLEYVKELVADWEGFILNPNSDLEETKTLRHARTRVLEVLTLPDEAQQKEEVEQ